MRVDDVLGSVAFVTELQRGLTGVTDRDAHSHGVILSGNRLKQTRSESPSTLLSEGQSPFDVDNEVEGTWALSAPVLLFGWRLAHMHDLIIR
jgi:hypothetical protein